MALLGVRPCLSGMCHTCTQETHARDCHCALPNRMPPAGQRGAGDQPAEAGQHDRHLQRLLRLPAMQRSCCIHCHACKGGASMQQQVTRPAPWRAMHMGSTCTVIAQDEAPFRGNCTRQCATTAASVASILYRRLLSCNHHAAALPAVAPCSKPGQTNKGLFEEPALGTKGFSTTLAYAATHKAQLSLVDWLAHKLALHNNNPVSTKT